VLEVNQHLLHNFLVAVLAFAEHLAVARQKRERHKDAVGPQLPRTARNVGVPEAAVFRTRISVEDFANVLSSKPVFLLLRLFIKNQQKISGHDVIERVNLAIDRALLVDVLINPRLDVIQVTLVSGAKIDKVLAIEIESFRVSPAFE